MIENFYIIKEENALIERKRELGNKKLKNNELIASSGITRNARRYLKPEVIDQSSMALVKQAIKDNIQVDKELTIIKEKLHHIRNEKATERNMALINLFKEIFEPEHLLELYNECDRRIRGETPFKISFAWKEFNEHKLNAAKYKKMAIENIDNMQSFRLTLTNLIDQGCDKFGKSEFLQFISPLNRLILPIAELEKMKRKIIG